MIVTRRRLIGTAAAGAGLIACPAVLRAQAPRVLRLSHQFPGGTLEQGDARDRICRRFGQEIERRTGKEAHAVVLGHIQRGGTPTAFDRWLATRFGLNAIAAVRDGDFGTMMALRGTDIVRVPLIEGTGELKLVQPEEYAEAEVFFG